MNIVDAFTFFNEVDLLKIRLELLFEHVDVFLICEANHTFTGKAKPYNFEINCSEFEPWLDKIRYIRYEPDLTGLDFSVKDTSYNANSAAWQIERGQRNALADYVMELNDADIVLVTDLDEIPNPDTIASIRHGQFNGEKARLQMEMHYYYMNCRGIGANNAKWYHPFMSSVAGIKISPDLHRIRNTEHMPFIANAGWHFSYLGGVEAISRKLESFSHTEMNTPEFNEPTHLQNCIELGIDYLHRPGFEYAFYPVAAYPLHLADLMRRNGNLIRASLV